MQDFVYNFVYQEVIRIIWKYKGFCEEMYICLKVVEIRGSWNGEDFLKFYMEKLIQFVS